MLTPSRGQEYIQIMAEISPDHDARTDGTKLSPSPQMHEFEPTIHADLSFEAFSPCNTRKSVIQIVLWPTVCLYTGILRLGSQKWQMPKLSRYSSPGPCGRRTNPATIQQLRFKGVNTTPSLTQNSSTHTKTRNLKG